MGRDALRSAWMCLVLLVLAGSLRFYRLGEWPFHTDELATQFETDSLFGRRDEAIDTAVYRLPRAIPVGYLVHDLGYRTLGRGEWGSRFPMAVLGTLASLVVFLGLIRPLGRIQAFIAGLLLALWPEHIYYSQDGRFYPMAFLVSVACTIAGAQAVARRSVPWTAVAGLFGILGMFTHSTLILLLPTLFAAIFLACWPARGRSVGRLLGVVATCIAIAAMLYIGYTKPLLGQWNTDVGWDFSSFRSLANSIFHLGWPTAILAGFGAFLAVLERDEQDRYWLVWMALWAGSGLVLPQFMPFRPAYSFALALGVIVLVAKGIERIYRLLLEQSRLAAIAWVATACLLNLPSLASHYIDGSSSNHRIAAKHIRERMQPGDVMIAVSAELLMYYLPEGGVPHSLNLYVPASAIEVIQQQQKFAERVWVVLNYGKGTRPDVLLAWLRANGTQQLEWCRRRYDAFEYSTDVFLMHKKASK